MKDIGTFTDHGNSVYIPDRNFHVLKDEIIASVRERCEAEGKDSEQEAIRIMCEKANIWPESIRDDAEIC